MEYDAIIIGAGAAGLAATRALHDAGRRVICLEAADRIGGRSFTDTSIFGVPFDLGGHWLHYSDVNSFIPIGQSLGFDLYPDPSHVHLAGALADGPAIERLEEITAELKKLGQAEQDTSMADAITPKDVYDRTSLLLKALSAGRDLGEISVQDWHTGELEGDNWFCRQGFGAIVTAHADGLPVRTHTPVTAIICRPDGVEVETDDGTLRAAHVVVTVSVGVLASDAIRFDPPLEAPKLRALDGITMGVYNHAAMLFDPASLPVEADTWVSYPIDEVSGTMARGGGILCNISGTGLCSFEHVGNFARELEAAGEEAAIDFALSRMVDVFGADIRKGFRKGHATRWAANRFTHGAYSGTLPSQGTRGEDLRHALRQPHADTIHFAGEAMNEGETVCVSGAHKEGLRAADEILAQL
ncbi:MAG: NAD(P)/FAD-dependent oxidoreductase [Pseudomonadota bacterium]